MKNLPLEYQIVTKTYLPSNICDSSDSSDSRDISDISDSSVSCDSSAKNNFFTKNLFFHTQKITQKNLFSQKT